MRIWKNLRACRHGARGFPFGQRHLDLKKRFSERQYLPKKSASGKRGAASTSLCTMVVSFVQTASAWAARRAGMRAGAMALLTLARILGDEDREANEARARAATAVEAVDDEDLRLRFRL